MTISEKLKVAALVVLILQGVTWVLTGHNGGRVETRGYYTRGSANAHTDERNYVYVDVRYGPDCLVGTFHSYKAARDECGRLNAELVAETKEKP